MNPAMECHLGLVGMPLTVALASQALKLLPTRTPKLLPCSTSSCRFNKHETCCSTPRGSPVEGVLGTKPGDSSPPAKCPKKFLISFMSGHTCDSARKPCGSGADSGSKGTCSRRGRVSNPCCPLWKQMPTSTSVDRLLLGQAPPSLFLNPTTSQLP